MLAILQQFRRCHDHKLATFQADMNVSRITHLKYIGRSPRKSTRVRSIASIDSAALLVHVISDSANRYGVFKKLGRVRAGFARAQQGGARFLLPHPVPMQVERQIQPDRLDTRRRFMFALGLCQERPAASGQRYPELLCEQKREITFVSPLAKEAFAVRFQNFMGTV